MRYLHIALLLAVVLAIAANSNSHEKDAHSHGKGKRSSSSSDSDSDEKSLGPHGNHGHKVTPKKTTTTKKTTTPKRRTTSTTKRTTPVRKTTTAKRTTTVPKRTSTVVPTTTRSTQRTTQTSTPSTISRRTTTLTPSTTPKLACAGSVFPKTKPQDDPQLVFNPNISFVVWTDANGCDWLNMTCSGYFFVELSAESITGQEFVYDDAFGVDNQTLVTVSYQLPWAEYGWGASTPLLQPLDNTFYCMVGSLSPIAPLQKTTTSAPRPSSTAPSPSIRPVVSEGPGCSCNYSTVWVDVILLFDASASTSSQGLQQMLGYAQTSLSWFNIQNSSSTEQFHTRVGIITYGSSAKLIAPLGSLDVDGLLSINALPYEGGETADIDKAIQLAAQEFSTDRRRSNARRVIALFSTSYDHVDSPQIAAHEFMFDNGILFVYNYVEEHGGETPELAQLASSGYFYSNLNDPHGDALKNSLCNANCYCPDNYVSYKDDEVTEIPLAGCYYAVNIENNYRLANIRCQRFNEGYLAQGKTLEKTFFLQDEFEISTANFWAGMMWNTMEKEYFWLDGTPVNSSSFQPFAGDHKEGSDCVAVMGRSWVPVDCRLGFEYICEAHPCDSAHYCDDEV